VYKPEKSWAFFNYTIIEGDCIDSDEDGQAVKKLCEGDYKISNCKGTSKVELILLKNTIQLKKDRFYTLKIVNKTKGHELYTYKGTDGFEAYGEMTFYETKARVDSSEFVSNVKKGQFPELIIVPDPKNSIKSGIKG
jgi:hypothetical protein